MLFITNSTRNFSKLNRSSSFSDSGLLHCFLLICPHVYPPTTKMGIRFIKLGKVSARFADPSFDSRIIQGKYQITLFSLIQKRYTIRFVILLSNIFTRAYFIELLHPIHTNPFRSHFFYTSNQFISNLCSDGKNIKQHLRLRHPSLINHHNQ